MTSAPIFATAPTSPAATPGTSQIAGRILAIDALRGFALLGILVVNIPYFATSYPWHGLDDPAHVATIDRGVRWVVALLFELKFYLLFSFLFGYSFTLQMDAARRQRAAFAPRLLRRLAGLAVLGGAHALLLFHGDILATYAVLGLVLLAARNLRPRTALVLAGALIGLVAASLLAVWIGGAAPATDITAATAAAEASETALGSDVGSVIEEHIRSMPRMFQALAGFQGPVALAAFLVGLAAGKREVLADPMCRVRWLRLLERIGYPVGLAGSVIFASAGGTTVLNPASLILTMLTAPLLAAAYAGTALRVFNNRSAGRRIQAALAPAGRMALTNYLCQSLSCAVIFTGWGFGLIGSVPPLMATIIAATIFGGQLLVSSWWLARHQYGPVEWALRAVTNAARPPWRRVRNRQTAEFRRAVYRGRSVTCRPEEEPPQGDAGRRR